MEHITFCNKVLWTGETTHNLVQASSDKRTCGAKHGERNVLNCKDHHQLSQCLYILMKYLLHQLIVH